MVRVRGKNQRRQYASEEAERRKDAKVEFRVSHYLHSDTRLKATFLAERHNLPLSVGAHVSPS